MTKEMILLPKHRYESIIRTENTESDKQTSAKEEISP